MQKAVYNCLHPIISFDPSKLSRASAIKKHPEYCKAQSDFYKMRQAAKRQAMEKAMHNVSSAQDWETMTILQGKH